MLNSDIYLSIFQTKTTPAPEIVVLFRIYFQLMNIHKEINSTKDDEQFWEKASNYILEETNKRNGQMGKLNEENIKLFDFSDKNIQTLSKIAEPYLNILSPAYYTKECPAAGVYCFFIKDALEYCGIIPSKKAIVPRLYQNANYNVNCVKEVIDKLEKFKEKL